jgi:S-DNA-T family DNA segregation ATPase FtsK/SpoIIIE
MNGAEMLLGRGDMFYYPTRGRRRRCGAGCFVSDAEIANIVDSSAATPNRLRPGITEIMESPDATRRHPRDADGEQDDRLQEAVEMVLTDGQASISMLQRRMKIGYARAGRLIDDMATRGIVSKSAGSKPREVLISYDQYLLHKEALLK